MVRVNAIYARQSVDRIDSISIESQIAYCLYETKGEDYRVYLDKGYSGKNTDRPEFQKMLAAIRNGEIKRVICYKLDRCSRSILDFANMIDEFQRHQVEFVSCTEKFDTASPMGRAMLNICIVFAQLERETIQQRVTDAYHARSQRGFYMGGRIPFAFKLEPYRIQGKKTSRYCICPEEADVLSQIYIQYSNPQTSVGDVVRYLHDRGILNPRRQDGQWNKTYLTSILKNPIYVKADIDVYSFFKEQGTVILNEPEEFSGLNGCYLFTENTNKRKTLCLQGQILVIAPHEGFIPSDIWLKCRLKCLNNKQYARPVKAKNTWLAGKIKCPLCGYGLVVKKWEDNRYYMCSKHLTDKSACQGVGGLKAELIETAILEEVTSKIRNLGNVSACETWKRSPDEEALAIQIAQFQKSIDSYLAQIPQANAVASIYINQRIEEIDRNKRECEQKIVELEKRKIVDSKEKTEIHDWIPLWNRLTNTEKCAVIDILITSVSATKEKITIFWKL